MFQLWIIEIGLSNSLPTAWKKRGLTPKADTLSKIADYFHVSTDFLLTDASENSFIRNIQFHLKSRGISEKTFCQDMGLSCSNLADFDAAGLTADQMRKFHNYLGLELNELKLGFTSLNKKQNPPAVSGEGKYPKKYDLLNETNRAIVDRLIADLAKSQSDQ